MQSIFYKFLPVAWLVAVVAHAQNQSSSVSSADTTQLAPVVVGAMSAGQFSTGTGPSAVLKPIDILLVPGSAADINRALQTLPGVQTADEGNALFVRGGDSRETATWVNGIKFPGNPQLNTPLGTFSGSISPLQAASVEFAAGGFGVGTGDVLSGAVKIKTVGAPHERSGAVNLGIGNTAVALNLPWTERAGVGFSVSRTDLKPFMSLFPSSRSFSEAPHGHDYSIVGSWDSPTGGKIKWYGTGEENRLALPVKNLNTMGVYRQRSDRAFGVVSWSDRFGGWRCEANVGGGMTKRDEQFENVHWQTSEQTRQINFTGTYDAGVGLWRVGGDFWHEAADFRREITDAGITRLDVQNDSIENLSAAWAEFETLLGRDVRLVTGLRGWHSERAKESAVDPRLALTWQPKRGFVCSLAGGIYHQVPEGIDYAEKFPRWPAMQAEQVIASVEWKRGLQLLRVETYAKRYHRLVARDRDFIPHGGGTGDAYGLDIMAKTPLPWEINGRLTWSMVDAERTDPQSGTQATAPWAVPHSIALVVDRDIGNWKVSLAGRLASGRAFTPIVGSASTVNGRQPVFGAAYSERYPTFRRIDCTLVRTWKLSDRVMAVTYIAGFNLFGWDNVYAYDYSDDFNEKRPVPGLFSQSLYFGVNLLFR